MKKNLIKMMLAAVVVVASGVNIYNSQKENGMSDVVLANVDALASDDEIIIKIFYELRMKIHFYVERFYKKKKKIYLKK